MKLKLKFKKLPSQGPNFHVATDQFGVEVGFVWRPVNTRTEKNAWRIHKIVPGTENPCVAHEWSLPAAKSMLETVLNPGWD